MYPAGEPGVERRILDLGGGARVRAAVAGPGDGISFVLAHGWGASLYGYRQVLPALAALGCHAVAVDLHGYPLGDPPPGGGEREHTTAGMARRFEAILERLALRRPILVGHSMAGRLVLEYALAHPDLVRGVAVLAPVGIGELRRGIRRAALPVLALGRLIGPVAVRRWIVRSIVAAVTGRLRRPTDRDIDEYWAPTRFPAYLVTVHELLRDFDWRAIPADRVAGLPVPLTVLLGERDPVIRSPRSTLLAAALAPHRVRTVPGCGHIIADEAAPAVVDALRELVAVST